MGRLRTLAMVLGLCVPAMLGAEEPIRVAVYKGGYGAEGICGLLQATPDTRAEYVSELDIATLRKYEVLVLPQTKRPKELTFDRMELIRSWVKDGHGLLVTHDAVGYRSHKSFFPQLSEGTGNPYSEQEAYSKECCIARTHPLTEGLALKERFYLSYYDYITINPGKDGVVVVRGVAKTEEAAASSAAVVVCGEVGKGRYVANGAALGISMAGEVRPMGGEKRLLLNCIRWLAGKETSAGIGEDIGQGAYLGPTASSKSF